MRSFFKARKAPKNRFRRALAAGFLAASIMGTAMANPSGPQVSNGQVNITGLGGSTVNVEQLTNRAIVNWNSFSIGAQEAVRFLQPSQMAIILNRVTGQDPSQILGSLSANGQVFLINPNGILFGPNSTVDVGGLVASTLGLTDNDFLAGRYNFSQDPAKELASIINQGTIRITDGGYAVLTAPLVSNEGLIVANLGKVVLAGGEKTTLNFDGRNLINYDLAALNGSAGTVLLPKEAVGGMLADMLGAQDRAGQLVQRADGSMALEGGSGLTFQGGVASANGIAGQQAGTVAVDSARLTVLGNGSVTSADGLGLNSDGGNVYALSDLDSGTTVGELGSLLSARGGESGDGGFIEFSGAHFLLGSARDATASNGLAGTFFLDPTDITIVDGALGGSVITGVTDTITDGDINSDLAGMNVSLQADNSISFSPGVQISGPNNLSLEATGNALDFDDAIINVANLEAFAGGFMTLGSASITAGTVILSTDGGIAQDDLGILRPGVTATNFGVRTGNGIDGDGSTRAFLFDAQNLALDVGTSFELILQDLDNGLNLVPTLSGPTLTVNTGGSTGGLAITATGTDATLNAQALPDFDYGYLRSDGDLVLSTDINAIDVVLLIADLDNDGGGAITQTSGLITAQFGLGLSAGDGGIGGAGPLAGAIHVDTDLLTFETTGNANIQDTVGGVTLTDSLNVNGEIIRNQDVVGNVAGGSLQLTATGGDTANLNLQANVDFVGTNADLAADNDVNFIQAASATVTGNLVVRADLDNNNDGRIDFPAPGGPTVHLVAPNVGLAQSEDFGSIAGGAIGVDFTTFAIDTDPNGDGTGGTLRVADGTGDFTLAPVSGVLLSVNQSRAPDIARFEANAGDLNVNSNITVVDPGGRLDLFAQSGINLGAVTIMAGDATSGNTTLRTNNGNLTQAQGGLVDSRVLGIAVAGNVGTAGGGTDVNALDVSTRFLDFSIGGSANILDLISLDTTAGVADQLGAGVGMPALTTGGTLELETRGNFNQNAAHPISSGGSAEIVADGLADFRGQVTANGNLVVRSGASLRGSNSTFTADAIGLIAGGNIVDVTNGSLRLDTSQASYSGNAAVNIINVTGDLSLIPSVTAVDETVSGASSNGITRVAVPNGNLNVNTTVGNTSTSSTELRATDDVNFNSGVNAPTGSLLVLADTDAMGGGSILMPGMASLTAANVGLSAGEEIGTSTNPINVNAGQLAVVTPNGSAFVSNASNAIALVNQVVGSTATITGNSVTGDFFLTSTGGITVDDLITAPEIALISTAGGITINQNVGNGTSTNIVLSADGDISGNGVVTGGQVGLDSNNIGTTAASFNVDAKELSVDAEGDAYLQSAGPIALVGSAMATVLNTTVTGNDATGDFRVLAGGAIDVRSNTTGGDITLRTTTGDILINAAIGDGGTVNTVLRADNILNDATPGTITSQDLGLAGSKIGDSGNPLTIDADNLSFSSLADLHVTDTDDLTIVDSVLATAFGDFVTGNTAVTDVEITAADNLSIDAAMNGLSGNAVELTSTGGDINQTAGNIQATTIATLSAAGSVLQGNGPTIDAATVGLQAGNGNVGTPGPDSGAIDINATNLVLDAANGSANVRDLSGGLTLVDTVNTISGATITGTAIGGSLELKALGANANLVISDDVTVGLGSDLVADGDVVINNNLNVTNNLVIIADNDNDDAGAITGSGSVTSAGLGLAAAGNIDDGLGGPLVVDVDTFAVRGSGNVFVEDQTGTFTVASVTGVDESVSVAQAGGNLQLVASGGDLILNTQANAGGNLGLNSITNVFLNSDVNAPAGAGNAVIIADSDNNGSGGITQAGGTTVTGASVGLSAGEDIGSSAAPIQINADQLAAETSGGSIFVSDTAGGLSLVDSVTGLGTTITGNNASGSFGVTTAGLFSVDDDVTADQILLTSSGNSITVNQNVTGTTAVLLSANQDITGTGTVAAPSVGLQATNIGSNADALGIDAGNVVLQAGGNANILDSAGGLTIVNQITSAGSTLTGNTVGGSLQLAAEGGDGAGLILAATLPVTGSADLVADDGVSIGADVTAGGNLVVVADADLNGSGAIERTGNFTLGGAAIGLSAGEDVGSAANPIRVNSPQLAATSSGGSVFLNNPLGGLSLLDEVAGVNASVTGNSAATAFSVVALGDLSIDDEVTADQIRLVSVENGIQVNQDVTATTAAVLDASADITGAGVVVAPSVGLVGTNIGTLNAPLEIQANNLTLQAGADANVLDSAGGLSLANQVTSATETVVGNGVGGSLQLASTGGDGATLILASNLNVGVSADLVADDDVVVGAALTVANNVVIVADADNNNNGAIRTNGGSISATGIGLQSNEDIGVPNGNSLDLNVTTLAVDADGNNDGTGGSVNVKDLAGDLTLGSVTGVNRTVDVARAAGSLKIETGEGDLNVNLNVTSGGRTDLVAGTDLNLNSTVTSGGDMALSSGQDLNVRANLTSGGDMTLVGGRDVNLGGTAVSGRVNAQAGQVQVQAPNGNVVVRAVQDINNNSGQINAVQLGLAAGRNAGTIANPITVNARDLSYNVGGDIVVEDGAGGLNLVGQVTALNETVNGNTAGRDSRVVANNGDLVSQAGTTVGRNGELVTKGSGDVILNADYTAANGNVVLRSAGDISGNGKVTAKGLGLDAPNGTIGTAANPINFDADTLTVSSRPFAVRPMTAFQRIPEVTAIVETVKDVGEDPFVPLPPGIFLEGNTFAQDNVALVEAVLEKALDNYDLIYTDEGWQVIQDDEFGTRR